MVWFANSFPVGRRTPSPHCPFVSSGVFEESPVPFSLSTAQSTPTLFLEFHSGSTDENISSNAALTSLALASPPKSPPPSLLVTLTSKFMNLEGLEKQTFGPTTISNSA
ncbi:hypothetical protein ACHAXS_013457 [Conticribra weissflogii]